MSALLKPRFLTATGQVPGDPRIWEALVNQTDIFAYGTANADKGGPFGALLVLFHPETNQLVLVGNPENAQDSNAVVSKGLGSAHAEAENLSPNKRRRVIKFLTEHRGQGWHLVQVSSGESCPSCRSKQVAFANELIDKGIIGRDQFHVVFKATYGQTKKDADFNDEPYDQTFRTILALGVLDSEDGLFGLEEAIKADPTADVQHKAGGLIYNPVDPVNEDEVSAEVLEMFQEQDVRPMAVIVRQDGSILSSSVDLRMATEKVNLTEKTAIIRALHNAAKFQREQEGKFESWNLEGATLYTNIKEIGPMAYAESLWYNLSGIKVVGHLTDPQIERMAEEVPGINNIDLFRQVAADYDSDVSPLSVVFNGNPEEASAAHLLWQAKMHREGILRQQADRLTALETTGGMSHIGFTNGTVASLSDVVEASGTSSHYDGKQADETLDPK